MLSRNVFGPSVTKSLTLPWNSFGPLVTKSVTLPANCCGPFTKKSVMLPWNCPNGPLMLHSGIGEQLTVLSGAAAAGAAVATAAALINPATIKAFFILPPHWTRPTGSVRQLTQPSLSIQDLHSFS